MLVGALGVLAVMAGLAAVAGGGMTLLVSRERMAELGALGAGLLLGGALLSMLPEALHAGGARAPLLVAAGYFGMFLVRNLWRQAGDGVHPGSALAAATGLLLHSVVDGGALTVALLTDPRLGMATFLAILLHKLPEGFSLASLMLAATASRRTALAATAAVGLATIVGAFLPLVWYREGLVSHGVLLGLAAGSFLYVGASDLIPTVGGKGRRTALLVLLGALVISLLIRSGGAPHAH